MIVRALFVGVFSCIVLAAALSASAHEGSQHVMGTVSAISADRLDVQTKDGKTVGVLTTPKTQYKANKAAGARDAMKVGDRVVIEVTKQGDGLTASEVRFAPAPPAAH